jgi:flavin-dependent dehydrogenase
MVVRGGARVTTDVADVAVVGGGPAGAITAALIARAGHHVVLLERAPVWRWRACGVYAGPAAVGALRRIGLSAVELRTVARPIPAMRVETRAGTALRLRYDDGTSDAGGGAAGLDRSRLDPLLLDLARRSGATVWTGATVTAVTPDRSATEPMEVRLAGRESPAGRDTLRARLVIGADGCRSVVAEALGVRRPSPLGRRIGLSFHVVDPEAAATHDARLVVIPGGYVGLAPVPGERINVGIVLDRSWLARLRAHGSEAIAREIVAGATSSDSRPLPWEPLDPIEGAWPLGTRAARRSGRSWLLAGDAAGFLDPFTGEGLHRAIVSAELAAATATTALAADDASARDRIVGAYGREMTARFATKDVVSRIVQGFLGRPALFEYACRRLAARDGLRATLAEVLGDVVPARQALDPRYLGALLRP